VVAAVWRAGWVTAGCRADGGVIAWLEDGSYQVSGAGEWRPLSVPLPRDRHGGVPRPILLTQRPDGGVLAVGCFRTAEAVFQDPVGGRDPVVLAGHNDHFMFAAAGQSGQTVVTCGTEGWALVWDAGKPALLGRLGTNREQWMVAAVGAAHHLVAVIRSDGSVHWAHAAAHRLIGPPVHKPDEKVPQARVVAFSPDGRTLAVGQADGSVAFHPAYPDAWVASAAERANRALSDAERRQFLPDAG
jgi:hypothetical protein